MPFIKSHCTRQLTRICMLLTVGKFHLPPVSVKCEACLGGFAISWSPHLKQMEHLQKLHLRDCSLTGEDTKHIAVSLSDMPTLVELNLSGNKTLGGSAISWSPHLKQMKHLQTLHLRYAHWQMKIWSCCECHPLHKNIWKFGNSIHNMAYEAGVLGLLIDQVSLSSSSCERDQCCINPFAGGRVYTQFFSRPHVDSV